MQFMTDKLEVTSRKFSKYHVGNESSDQEQSDGMEEIEVIRLLSQDEDQKERFQNFVEERRKNFSNIKDVLKETSLFTAPIHQETSK